MLRESYNLNVLLYRVTSPVQIRQKSIFCTIFFLEVGSVKVIFVEQVHAEVSSIDSTIDVWLRIIARAQTLIGNL